ncbi:MAG: N-acetylneuraminate synthase family protein [Treponema sp.]|nr:N-acetylneuraminate synthase family protein [Treponema sp.]
MGKNVFIAGGNEYSPQKVMVIAELGTSHGGDIAKAAELIAAASEAGADCIKFQIVYADEILHPNTGETALPGGNIRLYSRFKELEVDPSFYAEMKALVEKQGLLFLCTPFGLKSAAELRGLRPEFIKIASPELNHTSLLREIAGYGLPVLLSSGVSSLGDIEYALSILKKGVGGLCLLHCVTAYPAPEEDYNLNVLGNLAGIFGVSTGVSDHSMDPEVVPALAVAAGACVIEKHFCLTRLDKGLDDPIALPPDDFALMVRSVRAASEAGPGETFKALSARRGQSYTEAVLGDGVKRLARAEEANYERTNRSLHALRDINAGEILKADMFAPLRTEKILRPGLPPSWEGRIIGRAARNLIPAGEGIRFEDV